MSGFYRYAVRPLLFQIPAERAHTLTMNFCSGLARIPGMQDAMRSSFASDKAILHTEVAGLKFSSPVGLGAGFDKNGKAVGILSNLGFGFVEVGSVSANPSAGNSIRPRLFRLPADEALLVNYGVPNEGVTTVARRLSLHRPRIPLGISLVTTNTGVRIPIEKVVREFHAAAKIASPIASYLALNLHCPVSEAGALSDPVRLRQLLEGIGAVGELPPVFLKIVAMPDAASIDAILAVASDFAFVKGFILNTLMSRPFTGLATPQHTLANSPGALTGRPLKRFALELIPIWYSRIDRSRHIIIGAGGIASGTDAYDLIRSGASLVQLVTSLIYRGPGIVKKINSELAAILIRDKLQNVTEAVGADAKSLVRYLRAS